ncbi:unnamed protein product [Linum tenue]|uniref:Uncharacterized protein n=1 Tax=Linum tenue TaxID=586396 RepID=A0AAV0NPI9_9ROSI|nr:unnamed protein product [Linum tenue]
MNVLCCSEEEKSEALISNKEDIDSSSIRMPVKKICHGVCRSSKVADHQYARLLTKDAKLEQGKVKIVLTRQQLELLLKNAKELKNKGIRIRVSQSHKECNSRKWQPSLATIPEVKIF